MLYTYTIPGNTKAPIAAIYSPSPCGVHPNILNAREGTEETTYSRTESGRLMSISGRINSKGDICK